VLTENAMRGAFSVSYTFRMTERLSLIDPVAPVVITQHFGEDLTCVDLETRTKCITHAADSVCPIGYESLYASAGMRGHNGIDFQVIDKQEVYAATDGTVSFLSSEPERGIGVEIVSTDKYIVDGVEKPCQVKTRYWHLDSYSLKKGPKVGAGELIGWADNTGLSAGTHLHFELKPIKRRIGGFSNILQQNGYLGAIDPEPYFKD
jgi:murein DD-endopeptidase MepM/ murein hydrolase activator NlpD